MNEWTEDDETKSEVLAKEFARLGHHVSAPVLLTSLAKVMENVIAQTLEKFPDRRDDILLIVNNAHDRLLKNNFGDVV